MRIPTPLNRTYRLHLSFKAILISVILGRKDLPSRGYKTLFFYPNHAREKSSLRCYENKYNVITL